jgi:hypothetical protein
MNRDKQRQSAIELAKQEGAVKTLAALENEDFCYEEIIKTAADEVGVEKLAAVLAKNSPTWALNALRYVPDLGEYRDSLIHNAEKLHDERIELSSDSSVKAAVTSAYLLELDLIAGCAFECWFTMYWQNEPGGEIFPNAAEKDSGKWKWSIRGSAAINNKLAVYCREFELPNTPLKKGATCWMVVHVKGVDSWYDLKQFSFIYGDGNVKIIDTWGAVTNPQFGLPSGS